jgi:glutathionylspermidine synthase
MYPGHPNLLPAYLDDPHELTEYVRKPKLGREGGNITIVGPGIETTTGGVYGEEGYVYQLFDP